jgi:glycolate oxidase iron-sulfur subunit
MEQGKVFESEAVAPPIAADKGVAPPGGRAFDAIRAPEMSLINDCVHCGFCLPTCPTYVLWGEEMDSPRGRIVLMKGALEEGSEMSPQVVTHWDRCLGCMSCVTACPSGVQYDKLIEDTRAQVERNHRRRVPDQLFRRLLFETFPYPGRLRALAPMLRLYRRSGLDKAVDGSGLMDRFPRLKTMQDLAPDVPVRSSLRRLPVRTPARGASRGRVGMLQGCVQRVFFHHVNVDTIRVLSAEGYDVYAPSDPRCCGALQLHTGLAEPAKERAKDTIRAFEGCDLVAVNAAGCGSSMKDYGHLFRDDPEWSQRAEAFSAKTRDVSELLTAEDPVAERHPVPLKLAYHDACHLAHAQGIRTQPRKLLGDIPGLELLEPPEWELCCGSAGVYNMLNPEPARELGRRKAENLLSTGAEAIASANPGCSLQIASVLEEMGRGLPMYHPMEILAMSITGRGAPKPRHSGNGARI